MDNFRTPNFELVADILYWLLKRYDPNAKNTNGQEITDDIETEQQRVKFVRDTCQLFTTKARLKGEEANKKVRQAALNLLYSGELGMDNVEGYISKMTGNLRAESERMEDLCKKLQEDE